MTDQVEKLASRYLSGKKMQKVAGEVRFIKDRSGDKGEWGWGAQGPSQREITQDYQFNPTNLKPLAKVLRAALSALGHAESAYSTFTKIKSSTISPDGSLGGRGYIMKIADIRRQLMNAVEVLSAVTDTLYDEMRAPHWNPVANEQSPREREEVKDIMQDAEAIKQDPEGWAEKEEEEGVEEGDISEDQDDDSGFGKKAIKLANRYLKLAEPGTPSQITYAKALIVTLSKKGVTGLPNPAQIDTMTKDELSTLIDQLVKQRGKPVFYGNGSFSHFDKRGF